jgi:3-hydroxyisobutyrate dehydrogenase-like beta-hydroxyacid dehydrogenase
LSNAGFNVLGFDVRPLSDFGDFCDQMSLESESFKTKIDILISVVRDEPQSVDLFFDKQALFTGISYPRVLMVCSTLSPDFIREVRQRLPEKVALIDAPMSGASMAAEAGTLTFMVGGEKPEIAFCYPLLQAMGKKIFELGPLGSGMIAKVMNNYVTAASVVATRQALDRAHLLGTSQEHLLEVIRTSSGQNWFASNFDTIPWAREGFDKNNTMGILEKDVQSALTSFGGPVTNLDQGILDSLNNLESMSQSSD